MWHNSSLFILFISWYPVLFLYQKNFTTTPVKDFFVAILASSIIALVLYIIARWLLGNAIKAGFLVAITLIAFFSYGLLFNQLNDYLLGLTAYVRGTEVVLGNHQKAHLLLSCLYLISLGICAFLIFHLKTTSLGILSAFFNVTCAVLVIIPGAQIAFQLISTSFRESNIEAVQTIDLEKTKNNFPDIYYIILDGYGREDMLNRYYGYDNSKFISSLKSLGFYVAPQSMSNYSWTFLSLSSSLNMNYVGYLAKAEGLESTDTKEAYKSLKQNKILNLFHSKGYKYIHIGSSWGGTMENPYADIEMNCTGANFISEFHRVLFDNTWLKIFNRFISNDLAKCLLQQFEKVQKSIKIEGPKFVFAHIPAPHHPFLFNRTGQVLRRVVLSDQVDVQDKLWSQKDKYIDQLVFISDKIEEVVKQIIATSKNPPVIIVQSDHGPNIPGLPEDKRLCVRHSNLIAIHSLNTQDLFYPTITPVNHFRIIFYKFLGTNLGQLKDKTFHSTYLKPYKFSPFQPKEKQCSQPN